jgi:hypothetical protein
MIDTILDKYNCFMAHCFVMDNPKGNIYQRISHAITNAPTNELCTSTIHKGDITFTNYFGGIGLIINQPNVVFSSPEDGATYRLEDGSLIYNDEIGTEDPSLKDLEHAIKNRNKYNEFRIISYRAIGLFLTSDAQGWPIATQTIRNDFGTFFENTKGFNLPYYFLDKGQLIEVEFDNDLGSFVNIKSKNLKKVSTMDINDKALIMSSHLLTDMTVVTLQNQNPQFLKIEPLRIYKELILSLRDEDFIGIEENKIFLNAFFGPASNAIIKVELPVNSKIITFDYNQLLKYTHEERIAVILHEYGHAFNPSKKNAEGEFAADDFAIERGYGKALKESLQKNIKQNPKEYDKEITHQRIARIG